MLMEIPSEDVSNLVEILNTEFPESLFVINFLQTCHKWKRKNKNLQISLLYTSESTKNGVFIGILESDCQAPLVVAYALDSYESALEEALHQVQIDWRSIVFEGIIEKHSPIINKFISDKSLKIERILNLIYVTIPIEDALKLDINCPDEVELRPLSNDNVDEIYEIWVMKDVLTKDHLKYCIEYNDEAAYGLFCKNTGDLLARCVRSHSGVLAALQTAEKARNKGYAKLLLKFIAKNLAHRGILPCSYTADFNHTAMNVFRKSGYEEVFRCKNYRMNKQ